MNSPQEVRYLWNPNLIECMRFVWDANPNSENANIVWMTFRTLASPDHPMYSHQLVMVSPENFQYGFVEDKPRGISRDHARHYWKCLTDKNWQGVNEEIY